MEWNRNGNGIKISPKNEIDAKWNGNGMEILSQNKSMQNGMEREWNWNGNGMDINGHPDMEVKLNGIEWKRKGNEMER